MKPFIIRWLCTTVAVAVAAWMTGISYSGVWSLFVVALLLGLVNAFVRPVLMLLGLPFIVVTLGFAILVLNALLFWMVSGLVPDFKVSGFWQAFFAALIVSIVNWVLSLFFKTSDGRYHLITHHGVAKPVAGRVIEIDVEPRP
jgi:putative membrane protein